MYWILSSSNRIVQDWHPSSSEMYYLSQQLGHLGCDSPTIRKSLPQIITVASIARYHFGTHSRFHLRDPLRRSSHIHCRHHRLTISSTSCSHFSSFPIQFHLGIYCWLSWVFASYWRLVLCLSDCFSGHPHEYIGIPLLQGLAKYVFIGQSRATTLL